MTCNGVQPPLSAEQEPWNAPLPADFFTEDMRLTPEHRPSIERDAGRYGYTEEVGNTHRRAKIILALDAHNAALAARCAALEGAVEAVLAHLPDDEAMRGDGCSWTEYMETRDFEALRELVPALRAALAVPPVAAATGEGE